MSTNISCDRCGCRIPNGEHHELRVGGDFSWSQFDRDLCGYCAEALMVFLTTGPNPTEAPRTIDEVTR